jgi:hypothetical protein
MRLAVIRNINDVASLEQFTIGYSLARTSLTLATILITSLPK